MRALFIGFGSVGREIARILSRDRDRYPRLKDFELTVVGITTRSRGALADPDGLDLDRSLGSIETKGRFDQGDAGFAELTSEQAVTELDYDVLIELSTLVIENRGEPAATYLRTALTRGRHGVSANKGPLAFHFGELTALARERDRLLLYESTVMDGAPIFNLRRSALRGCRITKIEGILNSTSNFVLTHMEGGQTQVEAVRKAQAAGFAEADPSYDLDGWDAAAKLAVLSGALMGQPITPFEVERSGIGKLSGADIHEALKSGCQWKQVARAECSNDMVRATVQAEKVALDHPFARVSGPGSAIVLTTDLMAPLLIQQLHPTLTDTAYGVLNDLIEIQEFPGRGKCGVD